MAAIQCNDAQAQPTEFLDLTSLTLQRHLPGTFDLRPRGIILARLFDLSLEAK